MHISEYENCHLTCMYHYMYSIYVQEVYHSKIESYRNEKSKDRIRGTNKKRKEVSTQIPHLEVLTFQHCLVTHTNKEPSTG